MSSLIPAVRMHQRIRNPSYRQTERQTDVSEQRLTWRLNADSSTFMCAELINWNACGCSRTWNQKKCPLRNTRVCFIVITVLQHVTLLQSWKFANGVTSGAQIHNPWGVMNVFQKFQIWLYLSQVKYRHLYLLYIANPSGRAVQGEGLRPLACWDFGF